MALVDRDKMTELRTASQSQETAAGAFDEIELAAVAYAINNAANTGEYKAVYNQPIRQATHAALIAKGYTVRSIGVAKQSDETLISWEK